ncbi:MAG: phosphate ABC transporter permease subunit PstC [Anaerolineales bacterium]|nr:phosphate ABC transporter permease subunit PstC [Anaerolineales bacterium]
MKARLALAPLELSPSLPPFRSRQFKDWLAARGLFLLTLLPAALLLAIILALLARAWPILQIKSLGELLLGRTWHPLQGEFGFLPFIAGTFWVTILSLALAVPPCLLSAIYLAEYCRERTCALVKPLLDLLAGIPSVVYGVWGMVAIVPWVQNLSQNASRRLGPIPLLATDNPTGFSVLAGSIVLAVMIAPFIIAITFEVLQTVPGDARQASLALGASRWQTILHVVLPKTRAGILAGVVLGASRALGETMAVLMVVGNVAKVPGSIFDPAYPLPALIANNYGEMLSIPLYDAALLGGALVLLLIVLFFNVGSTLVLRRVARRSR